MKIKTTKLFSKPLFRQDFKSNLPLMIVVLLVMCLMGTVITAAMSMMESDRTDRSVQNVQEDFYAYLAVLAAVNSTTGSSLSYADFENSTDKTEYEMAFGMAAQQMDAEYSVAEFERILKTMETSDISVNTYVRQFEYAYALGQSKGCFSNTDLTLPDMMETTLEVMGVSTDLVENMSKMDTTSMLNKMYFTVMGLVPIFILIVLLSNSLLASQIDSGSMAYILSTPTRRSAVAITQAVFMILAPFLELTVLCGVKIAVNHVISGNANAKVTICLYLGMYLLVEAIAGLCYLGSCLFNQSRRAMAFGGGLTVWFFIASLLGMFGSEDMVNMGVGVANLDVFNRMTLVGLFDIKAIGTIGSNAVDTAFIWKLAVLCMVAIVCYAVGAIRFQKKDLPL